MQADKDRTTKMGLQGKLRLKRNNSDSSQSTLNVKSGSGDNNDSQNTCNSEQSSHKENISKSPSAEDSLADFKSPKAKSVSRPILNRFQIDSERAKKKILKSKSKTRKSTSDIKQPSIESSFFKPQTSHQNEVKESVPCPLCLRPFKDDASSINHMKTCAAKNKISMKQLLDAKKLQNRQAEERKAMGLVATPVLPERKKAFRSKKYSTEDDPQLQLVLAMSESLYQAEQMVELEQAAILAGIPSECIKNMNEEERKTTLRNFGFTTNKPATEISTNKPRKKKLLGPTILQTRSKEDKDRVLTERIACILTGDDAFTQTQQKTEVVSRDNEPTSLTCKNLKKIEKSLDKLWDKSRLTKKYNDFYVKDLKFYFLPSGQQVETAQSADSQILAIDDNSEHNTVLANDSIEYDPMHIDVIINEETEKNISSSLNVSEPENMDRELEFMRTLILKWRDTLNDSAASDLIIFVKNEKHIYVHKLVLHVQCSNILLDIETNDSENQSCIKEKISWIKYEKLSALAFLEFIYCGTIYKHNNIFENDGLLSEVKQLARLYQVPGLFTYLRTKQKEFKFKKLEQSTCVHNDITIEENNKNHVNTDHSLNTLSVYNCDASVIKQNVSLQLQATKINDPISKYNSDPLPLSKNDASVKKMSDRRITASPDMFESEDEQENTYPCKTHKNNQTKECANNTNLNILVELIDEDEKEDTNDTISNCQDKDRENISSQKTVINLSEIGSPQSDITTPYLKDIHGTVTPKNRSSPEIYNDVTQQMFEAVTPKVGRSPERHNDVTSETESYDQEQVAEAVTPKTNRSPEMIHNSSKDFINNDISKPKIPKYNTSAKLSDCVTPNKPIYTDIDIEDIAPTIASLANDNDNELMYTALTPPRPNKTSCEPEFELKGENIKKLKTDLSLFIDKVRRANARSALDTDSETDTPELRITRKNPFLKQRHDDSYAYLRNDGRKNNDQRRVISLLEQDILEGENKVLLNQTSRASTSSNALENTKSHDLLTNDFPSPYSQDNFIEVDKMKNTDDSLAVSKDESCNFKVPDRETLKNQAKKDKKESRSSSISDDDIQDTTLNESEMSMYSRYKKHNEHNNSIAKYREQLNLKNLKESILNENKIEFNEKVDLKKRAKISKNLTQTPTISKTNTGIEDVTLVSDSDEEEQSRTFDKKEPLNQKDVTSKSIKKGNSFELASNAALINIEDDAIFPLNMVDDNLERFTVSKVISSTIAKENKSKHNLIDLSVDSDEENIKNDSTFSYRSAVESDNSLESKKLNIKELSKKGKKTESLQTSEWKSKDIDDEISKILHKSPDKNQKQLQEDFSKATSSKNHGSQCEVISLSPISIISSPELCEWDGKKVHETNVDSLYESKNKNLNKLNTPSKESLDGFVAIDDEYFNDLDFDDDWVTKPSLEKNVASKSPKSSNISKKPSTSLEKSISLESSLKSTKSSTDRTSQVSALISSPILSQNRRKSRITATETTNVKVSEMRKSQSPEQLSKQSRKLETKSASATNFTEQTRNKSKRCNLQRSSSFVTPERNKNSPQKVREQAKDVTPLIDYSQMDTPELHKELKKYGLKPQTRSRATLLLTHIYNETHPVSIAQKRASSDKSPDSNNAPSPKRQNLKKTCKKSILKEKIDSDIAHSSQNCPDIAEEMDYNEVDPADSLNNPVSIKDVFTRLLRTNKDLYTKVLTYEPLPLEPLHLMMKQNGVKCKLNAFMDFLDEQCITFQVQNSKGNRTKKRGRKKSIST